jgi:hypothetical protein
VLEETGRPGPERTDRSRLPPPTAGAHDTEKLLDRLAEVSNELPPGCFRLAWPSAVSEVGPNNRIDLIAELLDARRAPVVSEVAEPHQKRHPQDHTT